MKTNKEFIEGIYKKADEIVDEKHKQKKNYISKFANIAAVLIIVFVIGININISKTGQNDIQKQNAQIQENVISLKTVNTFENLCTIIKNNNSKLDNDRYKELSYSSTENALATDSVASSEKKYATNNQVENVDEADIVKVDENYIYYVTDKKVVIVDATSGESLAKVAELNYEEQKIFPSEIYVNNDKLIVIAESYNRYVTVCHSSFMPDENKTYLIIYDISRKIEPKETRRIEIEGGYLSSRMIENNIYFAATKSIYNPDIVNKEVQELDEEFYKPKYKDTSINEEQKCIEYNSIYCFEQIESTNYLMLGGINLESNEEVEIKTFLGAGNYIYSSEKNMYIAKTSTEYNENHEYIGESTKILKFALNNGKVVFQAETNIDGRINNQFSMDERGEYFRIATTVGDYWNMTENTSNSLYVLNSKLELVGKVTDFAKGERIYSVRYDDSKAYVVTFKQTDPLFVIDLSVPTNPQILGELKIPGYSTYLHPYDETHLIGFGYDTKEDGTRITTNGLKMVMFDISDVNNPKELFKVSVGDKNTSSELTYNHKALLFSKEKNIIAFPLITYARKNTNTRAAIYEIDLNKGFTLKGEISNEYKDYNQTVKRIVFNNNTYYTLSDSLIKAADMETLEVIKEIEIQ